MLKLLLIIAAVPLYWERTPNRPAPAQFDAFHGESLDFRCTFTGFGALPFAAGEDVRLWYQTNGMGAAWWSIPATVSSNVLAATFTPSADPGAERLTIFFGAPSNAYAAAQVRFRNSPGAHPNDLEPPSVLDWRAELAAAMNAVYTKAEADARITELAPRTSLAPSTNYTDQVSGSLSNALVRGEVQVWDAWGAQEAGHSIYADYAGALGDGSSGRPYTQIFAKLDAAITTNDVCSIVTNEVVIRWSDVWDLIVGEEAMAYDYEYVRLDEMGWYWNDDERPEDGGYWQLVIRWRYKGEEYEGDEEEEFIRSFYAETKDELTEILDDELPGGISLIRRPASTRNALGLARMKDIPTNHVTHAELEEAIESIPEVDTSNLATKGELSPIQASVNSMWATLYGENVWIAITNYMRQVANTVPSLRLWEVRDSQTNMVYSSAEEIEHVVTQKVNAAKSEIKGMIPRRAWGSYQSSGEENPSSNAVTVVNSSKIMLTGGGEWYRTIETGGASVWVLKTNGLLSLGGGTNGYFKVCDAEGHAQIEVVKTADQVVGAFASSHDFDGDGNFTVTFNASGSEHPKVSCAADLGDDFEEEDDSGNINSLGITVEWVKNGGGMWVATIHQDTFADRLFVYGKKKVAGENLVRNNAPTALDGGIYINGTKYRIVPYSTGGKTYMTLEAWQ